jgi:pimeloyl-ACP methyl ester carboxylesterase
MMSGYLASFTSPEGENQFFAAYDAVLKRWPVPYEELDIPTRFGTTHLIASGSPSLPPLLLLHATGTSSTMWFPNRCGYLKTVRIARPGFAISYKTLD